MPIVEVSAKGFHPYKPNTDDRVLLVNTDQLPKLKEICEACEAKVTGELPNLDAQDDRDMIDFDLTASKLEELRLQAVLEYFQRREVSNARPPIIEPYEVTYAPNL